ncbi:hypothetical protein NL108_016141, partial [Boleophthalmus pectinirostris]
GALTGVGEALQQIGKAKEDLDTNVKCTFIDPLQHLHNTEIKGIKYQLKKVNGRRLDFDYRRRRRGKSSSEKLHTAWDKFQSSKELAERSMFLLLQNDVDHLNNLSALVTSLLDFHRNSQHILQDLQSNLQSSLEKCLEKINYISFQSSRQLITHFLPEASHVLEFGQTPLVYTQTRTAPANSS